MNQPPCLTVPSIPPCGAQGRAYESYRCMYYAHVYMYMETGMKSERINLLVTPEEKAAIEARAAALEISTSEMVRRAVASYDPELDAPELQALADELRRVAEVTESRVDAALAELEGFEAALANKASLKRSVLAELEAEGLTWPFEEAPR